MSRYHIIQPGTRINFSFYDDIDAPRKGNNSQIWLFVKDGVVRGVQVPWKRPSVDKSPLTRDFNIRNKQQLTILVESEIKFESLVHVYLNRINHHMLAFERGLRWEDKRYARKKLFKLDDSDGNFIRPSVLRTHLHVMLTTFRGLRHEFYEDAGDIVGIKKNMVLLSSVSAPKDTRRVKSGQEVACYFQQQQSVFARQFVILAKVDKRVKDLMNGFVRSLRPALIPVDDPHFSPDCPDTPLSLSLKCSAVSTGIRILYGNVDEELTSSRRFNTPAMRSRLE